MIFQLESESKPEQKASQVFSDEQPQNEDGPEDFNDAVAEEEECKMSERKNRVSRVSDQEKQSTQSGLGSSLAGLIGGLVTRNTEPASAGMEPRGR